MRALCVRPLFSLFIVQSVQKKKKKMKRRSHAICFFFVFNFSMMNEIKNDEILDWPTNIQTNKWEIEKNNNKTKFKIRLREHESYLITVCGFFSLTLIH